jgi:drug/metabolite transporter (DMT)-like permease
MKPQTTNLLLLHLIVLIFGFTGILGKLITLPSEVLVWWRMIIAFFGIILYMRFSGISRKMPPRLVVMLMLTGIITAAHWITFFEAIKVSTVSVTLACLSASTLFTALIEPFFFKRRISISELLMGAAIVCGLILIFSFETQYVLGITLALLSALLASFFQVLNGIYIRTEKPSRIAFFEMIGGVLAISIYLIISGKADFQLFQVSATDWMWLLILGIVCTAFAFVVGVKVMETVSPFTVALTINLEPVYGIILAWFIFGADEQMTPGFYLGTIVILGTIFLNAFLKSRKPKPTN